jgi:hypothetical protein
LTESPFFLDFGRLNGAEALSLIGLFSGEKNLPDDI